MLSASFWGLLTPSLEEAADQDLPYPEWIPCAVGFVVGCLFLLCLDIVVPLCIKEEQMERSEGTTASAALNDLPLIGADRADPADRTDPAERRKMALKRAFKLFLAITIHNIPEGVACGLVFGHALKDEGDEQTKAIGAAVGLAIGVGIQDIPEGAAVSLPIFEMSGSVLRGFIYGVLSGLVEPIFASLALVISTLLKTIDPWALAFSGGAMIYVTMEELIPEAMLGRHPRVSMWMFVLGFLLMMIGEQVL